MFKNRLRLKILILFLSIPIAFECGIWPWSDEDVTMQTGLPIGRDPISIVIASPYAHGTTDARFSIVQNSLFPPMPNLPDPKIINGYWNSSSQWVKDHALEISTVAAVLGYGFVLYQIRKAKLLISNHDAWCNWKSVVPLSHLQNATQQDLLSQLKIDLYKKYALTQENASTCDYTMLFLNDIKNEIVLFDLYLNWYRATKTVACDKLFWFSYDLSIIESKKARLFFILDLFMAWYSQNHSISAKNV
jgi:hypothetical protein